MKRRERILVVDDTPNNVKLLRDVLSVKGFEVETAVDGEDALAKLAEQEMDLVLLDVVMPKMNGYEVCRQIRQNSATQMLPVVMVTALDPDEERLKGIEAGADDFLTKPVNQAELLARVGSLLRIKRLHDQVTRQAAELEEWSGSLEQRVEQQMGQLEKLGNLRDFVAPQLAQVAAGDADEFLETRRREVTVVSMRLRRFARFSEVAEPEEVMQVLREYHGEIGRLVVQHEGTLERNLVSEMTVLFNDPTKVEDPEAKAVAMALAIRERAAALAQHWESRGHDLGHSLGIDRGYATLGVIGFEGRWDYAAIGTVTQTARQLSLAAGDGEILVSRRLLAGVEDLATSEAVGNLNPEGSRRAVAAFRILDRRS